MLSNVTGCATCRSDVSATATGFTMWPSDTIGRRILWPDPGAEELGRRASESGSRGAARLLPLAEVPDLVAATVEQLPPREHPKLARLDRLAEGSCDQPVVRLVAAAMQDAHPLVDRTRHREPEVELRRQRRDPKSACAKGDSPERGLILRGRVERLEPVVLEQPLVEN